MIIIDKRQRYITRGIAIFLFIIMAYLRHSYYLYPNLSGISFLLDKEYIEQLGNGVQNTYAFPSMISFMFLFGLSNLLLGMSFSLNFTKYLLLIYTTLIVLSALFYAISVFASQNWAFSFGSHIKNFSLGPVYPIVAYFIYKLKSK